MAEYKDLDAKIIKLSKQVVRMCTQAGSGHPSSSLGIIHLVTGLMYRVMKYDPKNPWLGGSDRLVLSEGHAVPAVYAAYCELGGVVGTPEAPSELSFTDATTLREGDSVLDGHPNPAIGMPFFDAATGSLGQGLSVAAGLAAAARLDKSDAKFFCLIGDGESREGQIWEAVDFIVEHKLTAVRPIISANGQGQSDYVSDQQSADTLVKKLQAAGMDVRLIDGHDWDEVLDALSADATDAPIAVVAKTTKGWGVSALQSCDSHGKPLSDDQLEPALAELDAKAEELGVAGAADEDAAQLTTPAEINPPTGGEIALGSFADACKAAGQEKALEAGKMATRVAWGVALHAAGADERIVATDGDVQGSTYTNMFAKNYGERYLEAKIAEQNMVSMAAGLAAGGRIAVASTFGKFFVRAFDQIEMAAISHANVKMMGSHTGVSLAADGPSQMGLCDVAFFRSFAHAKRVDGQPMIRVFAPSDAVSTFKLAELMLNLDGMCYMRTQRPGVPMLYDEDDTFSLDGFKHLIDGEDLCIVASGYMVHEAQKACKLLEEKAGLSASLVDAYALPLATDEILRIGDDCRGQILVLEDNYVGGFADEIAAAAAKSDLGVMVESMRVERTPKSAKTPEEILKMVKLTANDIAAKAQSMFDRSEG
jgi:transketolase